MAREAVMHKEGDGVTAWALVPRCNGGMPWLPLLVPAFHASAYSAKTPPPYLAQPFREGEFALVGFLPKGFGMGSHCSLWYHRQWMYTRMPPDLAAVGHLIQSVGDLVDSGRHTGLRWRLRSRSLCQLS